MVPFRPVLFVIVLGAVPAGASAGEAPPAPAPRAAHEDAVRAVARDVRAAVVEVLGVIDGGSDTSYGTGFVAGEGSLVLTNAHVLRGVREPRVRTLDGALLASVEVLLQDEALDLAVLRVRGLKAQPLPLADGPAPAIGARVVAVGHPRGYEYTVSDGIVSALRSLREGGPQMIQTTAPISPGSSGGPLLDLEGRVVGVCSLTLAEGQNINFALPASRLGPVIAQALEIERGLARPGDREAVGRLAPEALARVVRQQREAGDLVRASDFAERALDVHPKNLPLLLEAAEVAWSRGNVREVEALVERMAAIRPGWAPARQIRAALDAQNGRCDVAIEGARAALAGGLTAAQAAEAHAVLGECLGTQGKVDEALRHLDEALRSPKIAALPDYHALRAFLLQAAGRAEEADRAAVVALERAAWDGLVVAALRERGLPRLAVIESQRTTREGGQVVVRGVVRNRGPIAVAEVVLSAEVRDASGAVVAAASAKLASPKLVPGQAASFRVVLEDVPEGADAIEVRVVDFREP